MAIERKKKILLIDDSEIALEVTNSLLTDAGYEVRATSSLADFDESVADWAPDAVLADVNMPGVSGDKLCSMLKDKYDTAHVPVVLFSALGDDELSVLADACGADGYISKVGGLEGLPKEIELLLSSLVW